jgi:hypothetical protein
MKWISLNFRQSAALDRGLKFEYGEKTASIETHPPPPCILLAFEFEAGLRHKFELANRLW